MIQVGWVDGTKWRAGEGCFARTLVENRTGSGMVDWKERRELEKQYLIEKEFMGTTV